MESTTARADRIRLEKHLRPRWGDVPIGSITRHDVKAWSVQLAGAGVGPSTVQRIVHLFSASLNAAMDAEVIETNPAARIKLPGGAKEQERFLERDEYDAIRAQLPTERDQLVADVLVGSGIRWAELAGLHWSRVNLTRGVLTVVEVFNESPARVKPYPKGKRARTVPLTDELVGQLQGTGTPRLSARRAGWSTRRDSVDRGSCSPRRTGARCATRTGRPCGGRPSRMPRWGTRGSTTCGTPTPHGYSSAAFRSPRLVDCWVTSRPRPRRNMPTWPRRRAKRYDSHWLPHECHWQGVTRVGFTLRGGSSAGQSRGLIIHSAS